MSSDGSQKTPTRKERKEAYERTLRVIRQQTYDGKPLAARTEVRQIISRTTVDLEQADKALRAAIGQEEVFNWHGERFAYSRLTDTWYRVTAWTDLGEGRIQSHSKEAVDREDVPQEWIDGVEERGSA